MYTTIEIILGIGICVLLIASIIYMEYNMLDYRKKCKDLLNKLRDAEDKENG